MSYEFKTRVNGIPCICHVLTYEPGVPMRVHGSVMGDADPPESAVFEYELLDLRKRRAEWLDRYITDVVDQQLFEDFAVMMAADYYCN